MGCLLTADGGNSSLQPARIPQPPPSPAAVRSSSKWQPCAAVTPSTQPHATWKLCASASLPPSDQPDLPRSLKASTAGAAAWRKRSRLSGDQLALLLPSYEGRVYAGCSASHAPERRARSADQGEGTRSDEDGMERYSADNAGKVCAAVPESIHTRLAYHSNGRQP